MTASEGHKRLLERIEVISVPARVDLIDALVVAGSATSTELGRMVPEAKTAIRWHLSRLEDMDFIRRREDGGSRPVWEPNELQIDFSSADAKDSGVTLALQEFERVVTDRRKRRLGEWALGRWEKPWASTPWVDAAIGREYVLPAATAEDLDWLDGKVLELMAEFRTMVEPRQREDPDTEGVFITLGAFPWRPGRPRR